MDLPRFDFAFIVNSWKKNVKIMRSKTVPDFPLN